MYVVRELCKHFDDKSTYTEFETYDEAKTYFDEQIDYTIREWKSEGMNDELIQEFLDDCVTETSLWDWEWEMEILVPCNEEALDSPTKSGS